MHTFRNISLCVISMLPFQSKGNAPRIGQVSINPDAREWPSLGPLFIFKLVVLFTFYKNGLWYLHILSMTLTCNIYSKININATGRLGHMAYFDNTLQHYVIDIISATCWDNHQALQPCKWTIKHWEMLTCAESFIGYLNVPIKLGKQPSMTYINIYTSDLMQPNMNRQELTLFICKGVCMHQHGWLRTVRDNFRIHTFTIYHKGFDDQYHP